MSSLVPEGPGQRHAWWPHRDGSCRLMRCRSRPFIGSGAPTEHPRSATSHADNDGWRNSVLGCTVATRKSFSWLQAPRRPTRWAPHCTNRVARTVYFQGSSPWRPTNIQVKTPRRRPEMIEPPQAAGARPTHCRPRTFKLSVHSLRQLYSDGALGSSASNASPDGL